MHKKLLPLILLVTFLKGLVWSSIIPLWHFPDEQSHFAQITYLALTGTNPPYGVRFDLTQEIRKSEELLGTQRDRFGNNKFTYNPRFRIQYSNSDTGIHEMEIRGLVSDPNSNVMVKQEASHYPSFYYSLLAGVYRVLSSQDLFVRVFAIRILQTIFIMGTVYFCWLISLSLFPRNEFIAASIATLVSFQPMFTFVSSGINSDNIGNMMFTFYILMLLRIMKHKFEYGKIILLLLTTIFTIYFKPQFILAGLISTIVISYKLIINLKGIMKEQKKSFAFLLLLLIFGYLFFRYFFSTPNYNSFLKIFTISDFTAYLISYVIPHLYREVLPWYWGIYDWLGVTYPRPVHRVINWITLLSFIGFIIWLFKNFKSNVTKGILLLLGISSFLVIGIYLYDWISFSRSNIHLGVQGRYFFPTISIHMVIFLLGFKEFGNKILKLSVNSGSKLLVCLMFFLNYYALYLVGKTYYELTSFSQFINQVSQYKPAFLKGTGLMIILGSYCIISFFFLYRFIRFKNIKE